jgi:hypothetical protein
VHPFALTSSTNNPGSLQVDQMSRNIGWFVYSISTRKQTHTSSSPSRLSMRSRVRSANARKNRSILNCLSPLLICWLFYHAVNEDRSIQAADEYTAAEVSYCLQCEMSTLYLHSISVDSFGLWLGCDGQWLVGVRHQRENIISQFYCAILHARTLVIF